MCCPNFFLENCTGPATSRSPLRTQSAYIIWEGDHFKGGNSSKLCRDLSSPQSSNSFPCDLQISLNSQDACCLAREQGQRTKDKGQRTKPCSSVLPSRPNQYLTHHDNHREAQCKEKVCKKSLSAYVYNLTFSSSTLGKVRELLALAG
jgi:hypothetical protein